ncbi:MAG: DedA family protein [bacterium]|nr:DedA family protein [bacterium]
MGWLQSILQWVEALDSMILALVGSAWIIPILILLATIDGFFPPVPSESIVIAVAALTAAGSGPPFWLLIPAAALGAFLGDQIAFTIGRKIPVARIPFLNSGRGAELVAKANATIFRRPAPLLIAGRFIPGGRVAVNVSAGAMGFPRRRFIEIDVVASILWAVYSTILGVAAGAYLGSRPLLSVVVGVALGVLMGILIDRVAAWREGRLSKKEAPDDHGQDEGRGK